MYPYYDLAIWSQTHWKYIEIKVTQLGIVSNPNYKVCFILDKTSMYNVSLDKTISNKVKPLQLIWSRYPNLWSSFNTVHVDDIEKNFMLNKSSGILISPFKRAPLPLSQQQQQEAQQLSLASSSSESVDSIAGLASCSRSSNQPSHFSILAVTVAVGECRTMRSDLGLRQLHVEANSRSHPGPGASFSRRTWVGILRGAAAS